MKLLIAIDGSKHSEYVLEMANNLPGLSGATAILVHVNMPLPEPPVPFPDVFVEEDLLLRARIEDEHETRSANRLKAARAALPKDWNVVIEPRVGHPPKEILDAISTHQVDLAILGALGMDETLRVPLGSVSQKVGRYADCPVLVVRESGTRPSRALVALDRGPGDEAVLEYVERAPWLSGCAMTLTHVVEDRYLAESRVAVSQFAGSGNYLDRLQKALLTDGQAFVDDVAGRLRASGLSVDTLVLEGNPATVLSDRGLGFDLVVMGAKGAHGLGRFLLGSTSQKVLRNAPTSVLLVKPPP
ncbi:MAG: universal stress protein [Leptospirillia bacterium]